MSIEAMRLALEALTCIESPMYVREINKVGAAIKALRQAIEQAEQAQPFCYHDGRDVVGKEFADHSDVFPLYTAPPQRKPLTDDEIDALRQGVQNLNFVTLREFRVVARAIEAAHGIREQWGM